MSVLDEQPIKIQWISPHDKSQVYPPGLAYLSKLDRVIIRKKMELPEVLTGFVTGNMYQILNSENKQVYLVQEELDSSMRYFCAPNRGFVLHVTDNGGQEIIRLSRHFKWCACGWCWCAAGCCTSELTVEAPPGNVVGFCRQMPSNWRGRVVVYDADRNPLYMVWGLVAHIRQCAARIYKHAESNTIGKIYKHWSGLARELCTDADNFAVKFPMNLDVTKKAILIGVTFLVDFLFFEESRSTNI